MATHEATIHPFPAQDRAPLDGLYFRVSSNRQTTENQFEDLLSIAEKDASGRDWGEIRRLLRHFPALLGVQFVPLWTNRRDTS